MRPPSASSGKRAAFEMARRKKTGVSLLERTLHAILCLPIRFFLRVHIHGRENIPKEGGCVVCSNHVQAIDVLILSAAFPAKRMPRYMAKSDFFKIPVFRGLIRALGAFPVHRGKGDLSAMKHSIELLGEGNVLAVFMQGTRQKGKNPADTPYKAGAAMIASRAGAPMLPVCLVTKKQKYAFLRPVHLYIGKPIMPSVIEGERDSYREDAGTVYGEICRLGGFTPSLPKPQGEKEEP